MKTFKCENVMNQLTVSTTCEVTLLNCSRLNADVIEGGGAGTAIQINKFSVYFSPYDCLASDIYVCVELTLNIC